MSQWNLRAWPRFVALTASLGIAFIAQYLFTGEILFRTRDSQSWTWEPIYTFATGLLVAALGLATWALARSEPQSSASQTSEQRISIQSLALPLLYALECYLLSLIIYLVVGENLFVQGLWLGSAVLLIFPLWQYRPAVPALPPISWWTWAAVIALTGIGFELRHWELTDLPGHVDNDVALMGMFGLKLINSGNYNWIGYSGSEHLLSYDQSLAWSMRLFGQDHYGLVISSVLAGTLTLPLAFLLGRELFNARTGLIGMALLTIDYTHIHFSRILFGPKATLFATLTMVLLFRGLRTHQPRWFALAGLATGFGLMLYDSSRVMPVVVIACVGWALIWQRALLRSHRGNALIFGLGALIGFGPMLAFTITEFSSFVGRGNAVALWLPHVWEHATATYGTTNVLEVLFIQTQRAFLTFHLYGDGSPHFSLTQPMIAPLTAALFMLGLGYCLVRLRDIAGFSLVSWIGLTLVLGGVITADPPYWPHLNIILPAVALIAGCAADRLLSLSRLVGGKPGAWSSGVLILALMAATGVTNWISYEARVRDNAGPRIRMARYIATQPTDYTVYLLDHENSWNEYAYQFFNQGFTGSNIVPDVLINTPPTLDRPLLFVLYHHQELGDWLRAHYPAGILEEHVDQGANRIFVSFRVVPAEYAFAPAPPAHNPLRLPGWWLAGALGMALFGLATWHIAQTHGRFPAQSDALPVPKGLEQQPAPLPARVLPAKLHIQRISDRRQ